jgi:hypothetical protein
MIGARTAAEKAFVLRGEKHRAPNTLARASTTPSSSCAAIPHRVRSDERRGAANVSSMLATVPGSASASMRSAGASERSSRFILRS